MAQTVEERDVVVIEADLAAAFRRYKAGDSTRLQLDATLAKMQERTRRLRMPNQNYFSGYITAWFHALGEAG
jgi:hypothetical protein